MQFNLSRNLKTIHEPLKKVSRTTEPPFQTNSISLEPEVFGAILISSYRIASK